MPGTYVDARTGASADSIGRQRVVAVSVGALVVALLLITLGIAIGRASAGESSTAVPTQQGRPAAEAGPGPSRVVHDVGVGWARSEAGAVGAATSYAVGINSRAYVASAKTRRAILAEIVTPSQQGSLDSFVGSTTQPPPGNPLAAAHADPQSSASRYVPVGYKLESYSRSTAVISVWGFGLYAATGSASVPASTVWATAQIPLVWTDGDWKLDVTHVTQEAGPTPAVRGDQSSDLAVVAADRGFKAYANHAR